MSNFQGFRGAAAPAGENCSSQGTNCLKSDSQILIHRKIVKNTSEIVDFSFSPAQHKSVAEKEVSAVKFGLYSFLLHFCVSFLKSGPS